MEISVCSYPNYRWWLHGTTTTQLWHVQFFICLFLCVWTYDQQLNYSKQNFPQIWIKMEKSLVKWATEFWNLESHCWFSQHWFRQWLGAIRQQGITWINFNKVLWCHMASMPQWVNWWGFYKTMFIDYILLVRDHQFWDHTSQWSLYTGFIN